MQALFKEDDIAFPDEEEDVASWLH